MKIPDVMILQGVLHKENFPNVMTIPQEVNRQEMNLQEEMEDRIEVSFCPKCNLKTLF